MSARLRFADVAVGDRIPELSRTLTREDIRAYAEASGDRNPLHLDDEVAKAAGFEGVIAHGMLTMGVLATCLTRWAGDAAALMKMRAAFRASVAPGETLEAGGTVTALDPQDMTATVDVWVRVRRNGVTEEPIRRSEAVLRLA